MNTHPEVSEGAGLGRRGSIFEFSNTYDLSNPANTIVHSICRLDAETKMRGTYGTWACHWSLNNDRPLSTCSPIVNEKEHKKVRYCTPTTAPAHSEPRSLCQLELDLKATNYHSPESGTDYPDPFWAHVGQLSSASVDVIPPSRVQDGCYGGGQRVTGKGRLL